MGHREKVLQLGITELIRGNGADAAVSEEDFCGLHQSLFLQMGRRRDGWNFPGENRILLGDRLIEAI
ncbi:MAG: hypothetical protein AAFX50_18320, partial [Acidobacteriota bacterium]